MRWERLFSDLEAQLDAETDAELVAEVADRTRSELAKTSFEDRLRGSLGRAVVMEVAAVGTLRGTLRRVGSGWLVLDEENGAAAIVLIGGVAGVRDLAVVTRGAAVDGGVTGRLGIGQVLRVLSRDRTPMAAVLIDGVRLTGTIDRVGTDYFDLAEHPLDEPRRPEVVASWRTLPLTAVAVLRPFAA
jgi:hypothetical protein